MALEGSSTDETAAPEDEEVKAKETTHEHRSDDSGPLYLLCKSGETPCCTTPYPLAVSGSALVKRWLC